jgi:hypothetical protein
MYGHWRESAGSWKESLTPRHVDTSMIVRDFQFVRIAVMPSKVDAPLIVDANAVLAFAVPL